MKELHLPSRLKKPDNKSSFACLYDKVIITLDDLSLKTFAKLFIFSI